MQAAVSGLKRGLGYGLGAVLGGVLYSSLGPRMCFGVSTALPCLSLLLLTMLPRIGFRCDCRSEETDEQGLDGWDHKRTHVSTSVSMDAAYSRDWVVGGASRRTGLGMVRKRKSQCSGTMRWLRSFSSQISWPKVFVDQFCGTCLPTGVSAAFSNAFLTICTVAEYGGGWVGFRQILFRLMKGRVASVDSKRLFFLLCISK